MVFVQWLQRNQGRFHGSWIMDHDVDHLQLMFQMSMGENVI